MGWFAASTKPPGWLVVDLDDRAASFVHGRGDPASRPAVTLIGSRRSDGAADDAKLARELHFARYQCATLLRPGEYHLLLVEAPNVPPAELRAAIRWKVKDMLDYHVDDATLDVLDIPPESGSARGHSMYAIAAHNDIVQQRIKRFEQAHIPLSVIDIAETAQRNVGALFEEPERGLALLYAGEDSSLLTVNFRGELFLARRIDIGLHHLRAPGEARDDALNRLVLEVQRTFDLFDRQFQYVPVTKLMVAPMPEDLGLAEHLRRNVGVAVEDLDLAAAVAFDGRGAPDVATQWQMFHLIGASLRHEQKRL